MRFVYSVTALTLLLTPAASFAEPVVSVPAGNSTALQSAFTTVPDGGIIELAGGTYVAPAGGFSINSPNKSFTVRAASGANAVLSGSSNRSILRFINASLDPDDSVVFEELTFEDGLSTSDGVSGGVTLSRAKATFVDCTFRDNVANAPTTGGGAVFAFNGSEAHFLRTTWLRNFARNEGGGLRVDGGSLAVVHDSNFTGNRVNLPGHRPSAAGGAIHVTNARLWVTNTRFADNQALLGGAVYVFGTWTDTNGAEAVLANCTFDGNRVEPDTAMSPTLEHTGGAIHSEDKATVEIYSSRFFDNDGGQKGGAFSQYRSATVVEDSVFRGNFATASGGTVSAGSDDANDATTNNGAINRPSTSLTIRRSLIQGATGILPVPLLGGCVFVGGDTRRTYGLAGVPQMGTAAVNRATVVIEDSALVDCRAVAPSGNVVDGKGAALNLFHVDLTLTDSLLMDNDAVGAFGQGGGLRVYIESDATVTGTTFAKNTASFNGGAIAISGSDLLMDGCRFFENSSIENGSAILSSPDTNLFGSVDIEMDGMVQNSWFSDHPTIPLRENDSSSDPINDLQYNDNRFFLTNSGDVAFSSSLAGSHTVSQLNGLVVTRNAGVGNTDKSPAGNNTTLGSEPDLGALVAAPPAIFATAGNGDPAPPTDSWLAWAWEGDDATLDSMSLTSSTGIDTAGSGVHTLSVGAVDVLAEITDAAIPDAVLTASPVGINGGQSSTLSWSTSGTRLEVDMDRGVTVGNTSSGQVVVTPDSTTNYTLFLIAKQGGAADDAKVFVDEQPDEQIFFDGFESGDTSAWTDAVP